MSSVSARVVRAWAMVCSVFLILGVASRASATEPELFPEGDGQAGIVAYPPASGEGPAPVTVMLHGMCSEPERTCRYFASTITQRGWLLCPRATQRCDGGGSTWPSKNFASDIEAGVQRVVAAHPGELDMSGGRTLIGFSLGSFRALEVAQTAHGEYPRVILIGAKIYPDAERLRRAGVERLLLAAGDWDMMREHMRGRTALLRRQGFPVAFQSYGPIGHAFPTNFPELLARGLGWLAGEDGALASR